MMSQTRSQKETEYPDLELAVEQDKDEYFRQMKAVIKRKSSDSLGKDQQKYNCEKYIDENDVLHCNVSTKSREKKYVPMIPEHLISRIMQSAHEHLSSGCHYGMKKTLAKLKNKYYSKKMPTIVQKYIDTCETCQLQKTPKMGT